MEDAKQLVIAIARVLSAAVEMHDPYTAGHHERVAELARAMGWELGLDVESLEKLYIAALIHDVGKIGLPVEILGKPSALERDEMKLIKMHPVLGYNLVRKAGLPQPIPEVIYQHHERLDGSGYPRGLRGDEIIFEARILAVADVVEAIVSNRPHRNALGLEAALYELTKNQGRLYDPGVVQVCVKLLSAEKKEVFLSAPPRISPDS